jgi:hypothetical protein
MSSAAASTSPATVAYDHISTFIAALAQIGTYIGHQCNLFSTDVNSSAILDAAERRWDKSGSYTWQIPPTLSKRLSEELLIVESPDLVSATNLRNLGPQEPLEPSATPVRGNQDHTFMPFHGQSQ